LGKYELLLNEISIWKINDNPVPRKRPARIPEILAGLKLATTSLLKNISRRPTAKVIPNGAKIKSRLCPSQR